MKTPILISFGLAMATLASHAQITVTESFNYTPGALGNTAATGSGLTGNWGNFHNGGTAGGSSDLNIVSGSITAPSGYGLTSSNNKLVADTADLNGVGVVKLSNGLDFGNNGTFYISFLTTAYDNGWTGGQILFQDSSEATVFRAGELKTGNTTGGQLGINSQTSVGLMDTNGTNANGMDNLVVLKVETSSGGSDLISGSFWRSGIDTLTVEPTTWAVSDTISSSAVVEFLRFETEDGFANLTPAFDELRIGSSFADVTGVPEPSTYALLAGFLALGTVLIRRRMRS